MKIKGDKQEKTLQIRILIIGEDLIGKTSIIERYVNNSYIEKYLVTIGMDVRLKRLEINNCDVDVAINDTAGQERFRSMTRMVYKSSDGILLGFDLTNKKTFDQINYWIESIEENKRKDYPLCVVLFGNKCDYKEHIEIKDVDIETIKKNIT